MTPSDSPDTRVGTSLQKSLDLHGYSFQYAVIRYCDELFQSERSRWRFEVAELPVDGRDKNTRVDFVLYGTDSFSGCGAYLVCECKRVNPALGNWCFVRVPYTRRSRARGFSIFERLAINETGERVHSAPVKLVDPSEPYHLGIEVRTNEKGDPSGQGRGVIEETATQVIRGANGLVTFFGEHPQVFRAQSPAVVVPTIFTTADVFSSDVDLSSAELKTGKLPVCTMTKKEPWLWLQYNLSSALRHSAPKDIPFKQLTSLGAILEFQYARSIAVVGADGIESFLQHMPDQLEIIQPLTP